jgi:hypothetical protein
MTTVVVLSGLMLFVPHVNPTTNQWTSLTVLVLDTASAGPQHGEPVLAHETNVANFGGSAFAPLAGRWVVRSTGRGPITVEDRDRLLFLSDLYREGELPPVREECLGSDFETRCKANGRRLVVAQIRFEGAWRVRPVEIHRNREPRALVVDDSLWGFLRLREGRLPVATAHQRQLAGGILLEPSDGGAAKIEAPDVGAFSTLQRLQNEQCRVLAGNARPCAIVRFLNALSAQGCEQLASARERLEIDHHGNILYDLFQPPPTNRYLLFLRKDGSASVTLFPGGGGSVGCRPCQPVSFANPVMDRQP